MPQLPTNHALPNRWWPLIICFVLGLAVWVVFGQTFHHDFVNYDDGGYVYENPNVTGGLSLDGIKWAFTHRHGGNWHPLTSLSHMLDCQIYGLKPGGHHLTNILLHAATSILFFFAFRSLTGALWPSAFVAALFAFHPLHVESVAWISERKDVLSGLFFALTLWFYVRYARRPFAISRYLIVLVFFLFGLMSKPMLVTLPFVLLLLDYWPLRRIGFPLSALDPRTAGRVILEKLPLLLLSGASCVATVLAQEPTIRPLQELGLLSRFENAIVAYAVYLGKMFYPSDLAPFYPHPANQLPATTIALCALVLIFISTGAVILRQRKPFLLVGWLWYLGMLVPVIGLVQVGIQARADRYTYLPHIGLFIMVAWGGWDLCRGWRWRSVVLPAGAAVVLVSLIALARVQARVWRDSASLWQHALARTAKNSLTYNNLGLAYANQGKWIEAVQQYQLALQLKPDYAETWYNLGNVLGKQMRWSEAIQCYERALELKPDHARACFNLGVTAENLGKADDALRHYTRAIQIKPDYAQAHGNLGNVLFAQRRMDEAIRCYERALRFAPSYAEVHYSLGAALDEKGHLEEAIQHYRRAIRLEPNHFKARNNLGAALVSRGEFNEAIQNYYRALALKPDFAEARANLGVVLAAQGKLTEAIQYFQQALKLATTQTNHALAEAIEIRLRSAQATPPPPRTP